MEYDKKVKNRIKRIKGQFRGILKMIEDNKIVNKLSPGCNSKNKT